MTGIRGASGAEGKFVQISNDLIRNENLSVLARFIVCYVLSLPPEHHFSAEWLETKLPGYGTRSIRAALKELKAAGYMKVTRTSHGRGLWVWDQVISDVLLPRVSSEPNRTDELTCENTPSAQVVSSVQPSSDEPSSDDERPDKELNTEPLNTKDQKKASRRARGSAASATWSDQDKISGVRSAITEVYGDAENEWISDSECLELYAMKAPKNGHIASPEAYMTKIFSDTPDLGTHLAGLSADLETNDNEPPTDARPWACPRCGGTSAAPTDRGVCVWCDAELDENRIEGWAQAVLDSVKRGLREAMGYVADDEWAARVAAHILDGQNARDPARYVYGVITKDSNPKRFTPTPTPARAA